jgi:hypothetical protein
MFDGDYGGRFEHSVCIGNLEQGCVLFDGEFFRRGSHHQSMARFVIAAWSILTTSASKAAVGKLARLTAAQVRLVVRGGL